MLLENNRCIDGFTKAFTVVVVADAKIMNDMAAKEYFIVAAGVIS